MAINVQYQPSLNLVGAAAYQGGLGQFADKKRAEQLQRDLEAGRLTDSKYRADLSAMNDQYLAQLGNYFNEQNQVRGFQNANYQQTQSIADAQKRQQTDLTAQTQRQATDIANQQAMQQAGFGQQSKLADQQEQLNRWTTEFSAENQQKLQTQNLEAQMQQTRMQIQDAQQRQQWSLANDRMNQLSQLQAQAALQARQQEFQGQALQFGLQADLTKSAQQGAIQSGLSRQNAGQQFGLAQFGAGQDQQMQALRGSQALELQQQNYMQSNFLGQYAGDFQTITAQQAMAKDQTLMRNQQMLLEAKNSGQITEAAYARANNELVQQRAGLRQELGLGSDGDLRQAAFMENVYMMPTPSGAKVPAFWDKNGQPVPLEDPTMRFGVQTANDQAARVAKAQADDMAARQKFAEKWLEAQLEMGTRKVLNPATGVMEDQPWATQDLHNTYMKMVGLQAQ